MTKFYLFQKFEWFNIRKSIIITCHSNKLKDKILSISLTNLLIYKNS